MLLLNIKIIIFVNGCKVLVLTCKNRLTESEKDMQRKKSDQILFSAHVCI